MHRGIDVAEVDIDHHLLERVRNARARGEPFVGRDTRHESPRRPRAWGCALEPLVGGRVRPPGVPDLDQVPRSGVGRRDADPSGRSRGGRGRGCASAPGRSRRRATPSSNLPAPRQPPLARSRPRRRPREDRRSSSPCRERSEGGPRVRYLACRRRSAAQRSRSARRSRASTAYAMPRRGSTPSQARARRREGRRRSPGRRWRRRHFERSERQGCSRAGVLRNRARPCELFAARHRARSGCSAPDQRCGNDDFLFRSRSSTHAGSRGEIGPSQSTLPCERVVEWRSSLRLPVRARGGVVCLDAARKREQRETARQPRGRFPGSRGIRNGSRRKRRRAHPLGSRRRSPPRTREERDRARHGRPGSDT